MSALNLSRRHADLLATIDADGGTWYADGMAPEQVKTARALARTELLDEIAPLGSRRFVVTEAGRLWLQQHHTTRTAG